jgi:hypothetical protein
MNRRVFFVKSAQLGAAVFSGVSPFMGCENKQKKNFKEDAKVKDPCSDLSGLTEEDIKFREGYKYVSKTPYPEKNCKNCEFWTEPEEGNLCGGCDLFEGPVHAKGYCEGWSQKEI